MVPYECWWCFGKVFNQTVWRRMDVPRGAIRHGVLSVWPCGRWVAGSIDVSNIGGPIAPYVRILSDIGKVARTPHIMIFFGRIIPSCHERGFVLMLSKLPAQSISLTKAWDRLCIQAMTRRCSCLTASSSEVCTVAR